MSTHKNQSIILNSIPCSSSETKNSRDYCRRCHLYHPSQVGAAGLKRIRYSHICSSYPHTANIRFAYACMYLDVEEYVLTSIHVSFSVWNSPQRGSCAFYLPSNVAVTLCSVIVIVAYATLRHRLYVRFKWEYPSLVRLYVCNIYVNFLLT